jgi:uncharacterized protein YpuA (DUF1002 family)
MEKKDSFLLMRAIEQRWSIPDDVKQAAVKVLTKLMLDGNASSRDRNRAVETLLKMEAQNQSDEHTAAVQSDRNRFLEVARQLGIEADSRLVTEERADTGDGGSDGAEGPEPDSGQGY